VLNLFLSLVPGTWKNQCMPSLYTCATLVQKFARKEKALHIQAETSFKYAGNVLNLIKKPRSRYNIFGTVPKKATNTKISQERHQLLEKAAYTFITLKTVENLG